MRARWVRKIGRLLSGLVLKLDNLRYRIKKRFGWLGTPVILPYRSYGNSDSFILRGRVIEDQGLANPEESDSLWQNFVAMIKRHTYNEIPEVKLKAQFNGTVKEVLTDEQGYFRIEFKIHQPLPEEAAWHDVFLELEDEVVAGQGRVTAVGKVLISQHSNEFGIISDVDDTILISHSPHIIKKLRLMLLKNAHTRLPFEGVAAFYQALQKGSTGNYYNPIFYVSSSSWNLYDLLLDFFTFKKIPAGPFILRNSRLDQYKFITSMHRGHKLEKIEHVLSTYSEMKFILIGDSGQKDPEIYSTVVEDFPGRVEVIYIRDVSGVKRHNEIVELAEELKSKGVEMILVKDTIATAQHAVEKGYIHSKFLPDIIANKYYEELAPEDNIV